MNVLVSNSSSTFGTVEVQIFVWNISFGYKNKLLNGLMLLRGIRIPIASLVLIELVWVKGMFFRIINI